MGYYKEMFTPWQSVGSYEKDELAEMAQCDFLNGVLVPRTEKHTPRQVATFGDEAYCFYCGTKVRYNPNKVNQECRKCRHEAQMAYINRH